VRPLCCSALQCVAACCSVLQCALLCTLAPCMLQCAYSRCVALRCIASQRVAAFCSVRCCCVVRMCTQLNSTYHTAYSPRPPPTSTFFPAPLYFSLRWWPRWDNYWRASKPSWCSPISILEGQAWLDLSPTHAHLHTESYTHTHIGQAYKVARDFARR